LIIYSVAIFLLKKDDTKNVRHKVGVSSGKLNANGTSRRANSQVNKLNKQGGDKFSAEVKDVKNEDGFILNI